MAMVSVVRRRVGAIRAKMNPAALDQTQRKVIICQSQSRTSQRHGINLITSRRMYKILQIHVCMRLSRTLEGVGEQILLTSKIALSYLECAAHVHTIPSAIARPTTAAAGGALFTTTATATPSRSTAAAAAAAASLTTTTPCHEGTLRHS